MVEINKIKFDDYFLKIKIKNSDEHKLKLRDEFIKSKSYKLEDDDGQKISATDFSHHTSNIYPYFLKNIITPYNKEILRTYNERKMGVTKIWFQEYRPGDFHDWHTHGSSNLSGIYYVHLPYDDMVTKFKNFEIDAKEGDLIIFPSHISHKSPVFEKGFKTIISFNISFCN